MNLPKTMRYCGVEFERGSLKLRIFNLMLTSKSPVWSPSQVTRKLFNKDTRSVEYRQVLKAMHKLESDGLLVMENWQNANNLTVCYLTARVTEPLDAFNF